MAVSWRCRRMQRGEVNQDPVQEEFFTPRDDRAEALVREAVQNSLDASSNGRVRIRFSFPGVLSSAKASTYLSALKPHVTAALGHGSAFDQPMQSIVIEDFGTRGLSGDPSQDHDVVGQERKNDFYYFWRNVGRSSKSEADRGRWGLGKIVYPASSAVYSFFGLTVRESDLRRLLMGQAVLKVHEIGGARYCPYPYYGISDQDGFCLPVEDAAFLGQFAVDFELERTSEPGLSIVIPHARIDEISPTGILQSAIRNYFYPILAGTLTVEVRSGGVLTALSATTLWDEAAKLEWKGTQSGVNGWKGLFDFAAWAIGLESDKYIRLAEQGLGAPAWGDDLFSAHDINRLRARFEAGERLAFRVPVKTQRKGAVAAISWFKVFIMKDPAVGKGEEHYIRQGITISGIRRLRDTQVRGLVVIEDPALSALLGDSEGPAHVDWSERENKLKLGYHHGPSCVRFVKNSLREIIGRLSRPPDGMDARILEDWFFVENPIGSEGQGGGKSKDRESLSPEPETRPIVHPPPPNPALRVDRIEGGFRITGREGIRGAVTVEAAYAVRRGSALARYNQNDFDLGKSPIKVAVAGAKIARSKGNLLELVVYADDFEVRVTGFDANRDVFVRARHHGGAEGAVDEEAA